MDKSLADIFLWLIHIPWWQATLILLVVVPVLVIIVTVVTSIIAEILKEWLDI